MQNKTRSDIYGCSPHIKYDVVDRVDICVTCGEEPISEGETDETRDGELDFVNGGSVRCDTCSWKVEAN